MGCYTQAGSEKNTSGSRCVVLLQEKEMPAQRDLTLLCRMAVGVGIPEMDSRP